MNPFVFYNPTKIIFGVDTIAQIGGEIKKHHIKKVLFLYGKNSIKNNGVYYTVADSLKENGIEFIEVSDVKPNPTLTKVQEAIDICRTENVGGIIAVGGGSVIDSAKAIGAGVLYKGNIWDAFEGKSRIKESLPIFTVLTISATGSEMNTNSVITKEDENKKWPMLTTSCSAPVVSILDPKIQYGLPLEQTVNGAVDSIAHIMEFYFDGTSNKDMQDEIAEGLIRTVIKHSKVLVKDPSNYESRSQLMWCATIALNGLLAMGTKGGDWSTHGLEHSVSAYFDIAHGAGLAIMFPAWMKYVYKNDINRFSRFAEKIFGITEGTEEEKAIKGIESTEKYFKEIGAPTRLTEVNVKENDLLKLADNASIKGTMGRFQILEKKDILEIYKLAL